MNRIDAFIDSISRFLHLHRNGKPSQQVSTPESEVGKPQPICRLLDSSDDIAVEYSRYFGKSPLADLGIQGQKISGACPQKGKLETRSAPETSILSALETVVDAGCEIVKEYGLHGDLYCQGDTIGTCKFCDARVCAQCLKYEPCTSQKSRWHVLEPIQ